MAWLRSHGFEPLDLGVNSDASVDYPDFAFAVADKVARGEAGRGVLVCDTGIGMSIAANKVADVRAALVHDAKTAERTRQHNDANVVVLAADSTTPDELGDILEKFLNTSYEGGRHDRRLEKIHQYELTHLEEPLP